MLHVTAARFACKIQLFEPGSNGILTAKSLSQVSRSAGAGKFGKSVDHRRGQPAQVGAIS